MGNQSLSPVSAPDNLGPVPTSLAPHNVGCRGPDQGVPPSLTPSVRALRTGLFFLNTLSLSPQPCTGRNSLASSPFSTMRTTNGSQCCSRHIRAQGDPQPPTQAPQGVSRECPSRVYVPAGGTGWLTPFPSSLACCCNRTAMLVLVLSCPLEYGDPRPPRTEPHGFLSRSEGWTEPPPRSLHPSHPSRMALHTSPLSRQQLTKLGLQEEAATGQCPIPKPDAEPGPCGRGLSTLPSFGL